MEFAAARFAEQGYHPTSVAEIVQGLGVGKGVFYWYFSSKEELFLEILKEAQQRRTVAPLASSVRCNSPAAHLPGAEDATASAGSATSAMRCVAPNAR